MATASDVANKVVTFELSALERAWIVQSLKNQAKMLTRSREKEIHGGEVYVLRGKEIDTINALVSRFV